MNKAYFGYATMDGNQLSHSEGKGEFCEFHTDEDAVLARVRQLQDLAKGDFKIAKATLCIGEFNRTRLLKVLKTLYPHVVGGSGTIKAELEAMGVSWEEYLAVLRETNDLNKNILG